MSVAASSDRPSRTSERASSRETPPRALIVSGSVGAGHDGAASVLAARLRAAGLTVHQRDFLTALPTLVRVPLRACYALTVNYAPWAFGWTFDSIERGGLMHRLSRALCWMARAPMDRWLRPGYDVVISTYPLSSQTLGELRASGRLTSPTVTFLTDPAVHRLWVHPGIDHHLTVTQATAEQGKRQYDVAMQVGGPLVASAFARPRDSIEASTARLRVRAELGVSEHARLALILTGSLGMGDVVGTVAAVLAGEAAVPVVACGRNNRLRRQLAADLGPRALAWRDDVADLMSAADVLITNAGGLSFTEALVAGLPAICYAPIPGHGRANARVLEGAGLAAWARTPAELTAALTSACGADMGPQAPDSTIGAFVAQLASRRPAAVPGNWRSWRRRSPTAA